MQLTFRKRGDAILTALFAACVIGTGAIALTMFSAACSPVHAQTNDRAQAIIDGMKGVPPHNALGMEPNRPSPPPPQPTPSYITPENAPAIVLFNKGVRNLEGDSASMKLYHVRATTGVIWAIDLYSVQVDHNMGDSIVFRLYRDDNNSGGGEFPFVSRHAVRMICNDGGRYAYWFMDEGQRDPTFPGPKSIMRDFAKAACVVTKR
jgi:hypothetical protein